jgi:hypothetical protein
LVDWFRPELRRSQFLIRVYPRESALMIARK